ncbi:MAG: 4-(cytidine 5'-diphospho)-2-C-methyl-D-erythritol kinase [Sulfurimonas sp.]|nr:MAG: 4-(cytidine 5'-diphospho)-2-C-methyl-D-erythritol kinase [Sulfurimonas sp.]
MSLRPFKAVAKVNIFLKITGTRGAYHEIISRFMRIESLYDTITFKPKADTAPFVLHGHFTCRLEDNTLYKAYCALKEQSCAARVHDFFTAHQLVVEKRIPAFGGLGGGSSNAATLLLACNELLALGLSKETLCAIGLRIGADVPFFISQYHSANVSGIGEIVTPYEEPPLKLHVTTPDIEISTPRVYQSYRKHHFNPLSEHDAHRWAERSSEEILQHTSIAEANDLFVPACHEYPDLKLHVKPAYFFSGSGSSFFKVVPHG